MQLIFLSLLVRQKPADLLKNERRKPAQKGCAGAESIPMSLKWLDYLPCLQVFVIFANKSEKDYGT